MIPLFRNFLFVLWGWALLGFFSPLMFIFSSASFFFLPFKCMYAPKSVLCLFYISSLILWIYILSEFPSSKSSTHSVSHHPTEWPPSWVTQWTRPVLILLGSSADLDTADHSALFLLLLWHVISSFPSVFLAPSLPLCKGLCSTRTSWARAPQGTFPSSLPASVIWMQGRLTNFPPVHTVFEF